MYFFDKKVEYLIWEMKEGNARGVGTAKFLTMDQVCRMEVVITGCGKVQGTYPVYLVSGDIKSLMGEITLNKGKGNLFVRGKTDALGHTSLPYTKVTGIYIDLKTEGCLMQKWLPVQENTAEEKKEEIPVKPIEEKTEEVPSKSIVEKIDEVPPIKKEPEEANPPQKEEFQLYTNKWQQLCAIYPIVHPFKDGRAYLSIEPRDFVILQERFQPMVQNSFLLHGFYHYRHLLLGRQKQGKSINYYLGVPGVFYEKEKAAALFYGFESFEGAVTPATEGSFGYYMKRVQI